MGEEKPGAPSGQRAGVKEFHDRSVNGIIINGKGKDHDKYFKAHQQINGNNAKDKNKSGFFIFLHLAIGGVLIFPFITSLAPKQGASKQYAAGMTCCLKNPDFIKGIMPNVKNCQGQDTTPGPDCHALISSGSIRNQR
ncbi:MAG: hypothetical protein M0Z61_08050 [Nitrospiraceae bacterium]|nr:hypothetical protein [Nitrospiraceae bacterium]